MTPDKWDRPKEELLPCEALPPGVGSTQGYRGMWGSNPSFAERRRPMKFPRLIFLSRLIPDVSSVPSKSRDTVGFLRRRFQKYSSAHTFSQSSDLRNPLVFCPPGPRRLLLRSRLSPEKILFGP